MPLCCLFANPTGGSLLRIGCGTVDESTQGEITMEAVNLESEILKLPAGSYQLSRTVKHWVLWERAVSDGWLHVSKDRDGTRVMFTSQKDEHNPLDFGLDYWIEPWCLRVTPQGIRLQNGRRMHYCNNTEKTREKAKFVIEKLKHLNEIK